MNKIIDAGLVLLASYSVYMITVAIVKFNS